MNGFTGMPARSQSQGNHSRAKNFKYFLDLMGAAHSAYLTLTLSAA
jgi:hypothetical protein